MARKRQNAHITDRRRDLHQGSRPETGSTRGRFRLPPRAIFNTLLTYLTQSLTDTQLRDRSCPDSHEPLSNSTALEALVASVHLSSTHVPPSWNFPRSPRLSKGVIRDVTSAVRSTTPGPCSIGVTPTQRRGGTEGTQVSVSLLVPDLLSSDTAVVGDAKGSPGPWALAPSPSPQRIRRSEGPGPCAGLSGGPCRGGGDAGTESHCPGLAGAGVSGTRRTARLAPEVSAAQRKVPAAFLLSKAEKTGGKSHRG